MTGLTFKECTSLKHTAWVLLQALTCTSLHVVNGWTTLIPANFSEEAIWEELKAHRTSFIFDVVDSPSIIDERDVPVSRPYNALSPFFMLGKTLIEFVNEDSGVYSFVDGFCRTPVYTVYYDRIAFALAWAFLGFLLYELSRCVRWRGCCVYKPATLSLRFAEDEEDASSLLGGKKKKGGNNSESERSWRCCLGVQCVPGDGADAPYLGQNAIALRENKENGWL